MPTLAEAKEAADRGAMQQARLMYETILQEDSHSEDAWLGLADVLTEVEDKRICYNNVLRINRKSKAAKEGLRSLEPQHDPLRAAFDLEPNSTDTFDDSLPIEEDEAQFEEEQPSQQKTRKTKRKRRKAAPPPVEDDTPTPILVAFGLALSVVVFTIGSGVVYYILANLPRNYVTF